jgi:hypothetical protein
VNENKSLSLKLFLSDICHSGEKSLKHRLNCLPVTVFGSPGSGGQKVLISLEKEFSGRHREDLSRCRIINAKQSESRAKVHSSNRRVGRLRTSALLEVSKTSSFVGVCGNGVVNPGKLW